MTPLARAGAPVPAARVVPFGRGGLCVNDVVRPCVLPLLSSANDNTEACAITGVSDPTA
jgi:hypothetical protein